jgi:hypothetical protein
MRMHQRQWDPRAMGSWVYRIGCEVSSVRVDCGFVDKLALCKGRMAQASSEEKG